MDVPVDASYARNYLWPTQHVRVCEGRRQHWKGLQDLHDNSPKADSRRVVASTVFRVTHRLLRCLPSACKCPRCAAKQTFVAAARTEFMK